jgi:hypothetical protein
LKPVCVKSQASSGLQGALVIGLQRLFASIITHEPFDGLGEGTEHVASGGGAKQSFLHDIWRHMMTASCAVCESGSAQGMPLPRQLTQSAAALQSASSWQQLIWPQVSHAPMRTPEQSGAPPPVPLVELGPVVVVVVVVIEPVVVVVIEPVVLPVDVGCSEPPVPVDVDPVPPPPHASGMRGESAAATRIQEYFVIGPLEVVKGS